MYSLWAGLYSPQALLAAIIPICLVHFKFSTKYSNLISSFIMLNLYKMTDSKSLVCRPMLYQLIKHKEILSPLICF